MKKDMYATKGHMCFAVCLLVVLLGECGASGNESSPNDKWRSSTLSSSQVLQSFSSSEQGKSVLQKGIDGNSANKEIDPSELVMTLKSYVTPTKAEMDQLFAYVQNSPHVQSNRLYAEIMKNVRFVYSNDVDIVNAYANDTGVLCVFGGDARFGRISGLAVAATSKDPEAAARFVKALDSGKCGSMSENDLAQLVVDADLISALADAETMSIARSVAAGYVLFTISHEAGHHALGHVHSPGYGSVPLEVSRNQEREADAFASSIMASSPFGDYMFAGRLFELYARVAQGEGREYTHPLSRERLESLIRQNPVLASSLGVSL